MDAPPTNYNPNESMLSGGTESIMKVMGGGSLEGGGAPPGYNETHSVLSGGIDSPIVKVVGGAFKIKRFKKKTQQMQPSAPLAEETQEKLVEPSAPTAEAPSLEEQRMEKDETSKIQIRYVTRYELDDKAKKLYTDNIKISYNNIKNDVKNFERQLEKIKEETNKKIYHWKKDGKFIVTDTISNNLKGDKTEIKFIPNNIKQIIVLPPVNGNPETFFKQLTFLMDSKYVNQDLLIQSNIFIVSLQPFFKEGMLDEEIEDVEVITNFSSNIDINKLNENTKLLDKLNTKGFLLDEKNFIDKIFQQYSFWKENNFDSFNNGIRDIMFKIDNFNKDIKEYNEYLFNNKIKKNKNHINIFKMIKYCIDKITYILDEYLKRKPDDNNITNDNDHKTIIKLFNQIKKETNKSLGLQFGGEISQDSLLLRYYYSFIKKNNFDSYFIVNEPYTIIYPKKINSKEGILFTTNNKKQFPKPLKKNDLLPTDVEEIAENKVSYMVYNNSNENYGEGEYHIISDLEGGDPVVYNKDITFTLNKYIAILEVSSEDVPIVVVDMNGESYRIRVAKTNADTDLIYREWIKGYYTKHEKQLLDDIYILEMKNDKKYIADFLYYLGFYKCFNDISLLTNNECMIIRNILKDLYKFNLERKKEYLTLHKDRKDININCVSADVGDEGKITCQIYNGNIVKGTVEIDKPKSWNGRVTDEMKQEAFNKWKQQKK